MSDDKISRQQIKADFTFYSNSGFIPQPSPNRVKVSRLGMPIQNGCQGVGSVPGTPVGQHSWCVTYRPLSGLIGMADELIEMETQREPSVRPTLEALAPEFADFFQAHSRQVYYLCLRMLGDPTKAEDATHDVFLKAWRKLDQFRGEASWRTWIYRIAINHCRNLQQAWAERNIHAASDDVVMETAVSDGASPFRVLEIKELGERIQNAMDKLGAEYRLLLLLVADEELSYDQIAELTGQTTDAVRGKLHRARKAFAAEFQKTA